MKNPYQHCFYLLLFACSLLPTLSHAQAVDSVIVTGRVRNLSARLYREAPMVLVSRNNILQANREFVRPSPLNADGTFRVSLPIIYAQEEMYFNYGRISTAFLASPGTLTIELNADSLFTAAVPFRFGGVNAQINQQFARYKAFEAVYPNKPDGKKLSAGTGGLGDDAVYRLVSSAYKAPFQAFSAKEKPFPLLTKWIGYTNRYNAATFVYEKAAYENQDISKTLDDSLRPANDQLLTAARASAMNRFGTYATQRLSAQAVNRANSITVRALAVLLERYGKNITAEERLRLHEYATANSARQADLRFFDGLVKRSPDTLQRLVNYETLIQRAIRQYDSTTVDYLAAYWLGTSLPTVTLDFAELLYDYARPQLKSQDLAESIDELYRLEVKDSTRIKAAMQTLRKAPTRTTNLEISSGIFITKDDFGNGANLLDQVINANRGKMIYALVFSPSDEAGRQAALDAQRLRNAYSARDFALIYLPMAGADKSLWPEIAIRYNLAGDHLLLTDSQLFDAIERLRPNDDMSATVINRVGKISRRNAPLPGDFEEARKIIDKNL
ncbi:hypothetical protein [Spirosoma sp. KNUC1025]|uniref:hypothetical protein n=1 Tax=Spirosoma sp. KNUC1025 TaxID=2894082 RepID=UPI003864BDF3|nr:hypothetical protein LN737_09370 [Spirosoma sp. KNUC1025]